VQRVWRDWFIRWGLPEEMRLDNGCPWGGRFELPTALELWLAGLGVKAVFNPPRQPRYNGVVERGHGTSGRWAEVKACTTLAAAQERMDFCDRIQRERMKSIAGESRAMAFPGLDHSGRSYSRAWEEANWDMSKAEALLEEHVARRQVSKTGQVCICGRAVSVGRKHAGILACLQYDRAANAWVVSAADSGRVLRSFVALEITREKIMTLSIAKRD